MRSKHTLLNDAFFFPPSPLKEWRFFFPRSFLLRTCESGNRCRLFFALKWESRYMALHLYVNTSSQIPKVEAQPSCCNGHSRLNKPSYEWGAPLTKPPTHLVPWSAEGPRNIPHGPQGQNTSRKDEDKTVSSQKWHILRTRSSISLLTAFKPVPFTILKTFLKLGELRQQSHWL